MKKEYLLGLNIGQVDSSATLFYGSEIVAHVEEERYTRVKKAIGQFPINAITYCVSLLDNGLADIYSINLGFDHDKFTLDVPIYYLEEWSKFPSKPQEAVEYERNYLKEKHPANVIKKVYSHLKEAKLVKGGYFPKIKWYTHHYCHALSAHLSSPYQDSLGIVVDANSELDTVSVWDCKGTKCEKIYSKPLPNSLGWLYRAFTLFCGFDAYEGEGMLMGLGPYGKKNSELAQKIEKILYWEENENGEFEFGVDPRYIYLDKRSSILPSLTQRFIDDFGDPCGDDYDPPQYYRDVAYEIQDRFEKTLYQFVQRFVDHTGHKNLTLSGGVFLNCKATGYIWRKATGVDDLYVLPMAGDDGIGIGACMANAIELGFNKRENFALRDVYLGEAYCQEEIISSIDRYVLRRDFKNGKQLECLIRSLELDFTPDWLKENIQQENTHSILQSKARDFLANKVRVSENVSGIIASKIEDGKIVAWFQGKMEAGPRSLGNRSIIADPRSMDNLLKINKKVKYRQPWRPFCPTVLKEYASDYFKKITQCPYMINTFEVTEKCIVEAPAIVHVDKTARPQILERERNPKYYDLIDKFREISGVPIVMNTSMNIKGEPICRTPEDAIDFFLVTDVDVLVIENIIIEK
ncbi:carbamoyltransferase [Pseudomonadota bacterium]